MQLLKWWMICSVTLAIGFAQTGTVKSDGQPLPGATVRARQEQRVLSTVTDAKGEFKLDNLTPGSWAIDVAMFGFTPNRREVQIGTSLTKIDFTLELGGFPVASGRGGLGQGGFGQGGAGRGGAGRGGFGAGRGGPPQAGQASAQSAPAANTTLNGAAAAAANGVADGVADAVADAPPLDPAVQQASAGGANEAFLVNGSLSTGLQTQAADFAPGLGFGFGGGGAGQTAAVGGGPAAAGLGDTGPAGAATGPPAGGFGGGGFAGRGGGGPGGRGPGGRGPAGRGPGGRGPGAIIGNRRNNQRNQIRGSLFYTGRNSALDAAPFSLNGQSNTKAAYAQNRFGLNLGGPLQIPKWFHSESTFFTINYNGNLSRNGSTITGTVPTLAQRAGDFSSSNTILYDPSTRLPFAGNRILQINPIASGLLAFIPTPNQPGTVNNYRLVTAVPSNNQNLNVRVNQTLSRRDQIGIGVGWQTRDAHSAQPFGFLDTSSGNGINANFNYRHIFGAGMFSNFTAGFNRNTSQATPFFAFGSNVAGQLGIQGTSSNPVNFGPPTISFTNFNGLTDGSPSQSAIYSFTLAEAFSWRKGKHNWSFGGGYARNFRNTITDSNGRGTFTFTGLATSQLNANGQAITGTGLDFADFLLGLPQSNSIRFGSSNTYFRTNSFNVFAQDDYRMRNNLTFNLGLRYEYFAPWREKYGRIANLDIGPGFTAVSVVTPSQPGAYSGTFPAGLINADRNNFAPRAALAWKPSTKRNFTVRLGYGIYYNPGIYDQFTNRLSAQPPFAQSTTVNTSVLNPLTLASGLTVTPAGKTITNSFAVDRNYRTMYAQSWSVGMQSNLPYSIVGELNYTGSKGTRLDVQVAPNQAAPGSQLNSQDRQSIANALAFTYDTPVGNSIYHALQTRLNRRFRQGVSTNVQYTFSKSIDNSSLLGGTVAQDFYNLAAERAVSSFNRTHVVAANYVLNSPVGGSNHLFAKQKVLEAALKDWTLSGGVTLQSGPPLTARVLGNQSDTAGTGTIGSGRAQASGLPIDSGPGFFNLAAFTTPLPGQYGNAGRNTITGPGTISMNLSLQRTVSLTERLRLQVRGDASNFTNHVNISGIGTVVNSQTYGVATSAGGMRNLTLTLRLNF